MFAEIGLIVRFKLPFGQSQFRIELLDRAPGHRDLHILRKGAGRRAAALQSANTVGIIPAHPAAGGDAAGKAKEPAVLVAAFRAGLSCHRPSAPGPAGGSRLYRRLHQGSPSPAPPTCAPPPAWQSFPY